MDIRGSETDIVLVEFSEFKLSVVEDKKEFCLFLDEFMSYRSLCSAELILWHGMQVLQF